ncbi:MAG TPA: lipid-A-disaccharide synthase [bacterium]|nr:lipid-A-disaccharide synthase [bacterium]HOL94415.1 lipid-A-disaccharide synthase [bacterium]HPO99516.1 lipid-A-disaccharide synthase [bacterium]
MSKSWNLFISAGEESADLHSSRLCAELHQMLPGIHLFGFGGEKMKAAGVEILYPLPRLALIGFVEVIKHLPQVFQIRRQAIQSWKERRPDAVLLVDFPGFHLRLAKDARRLGIPVLYFIAPQVWAWRENRAETMRQVIDHLYVIFPFEEPFFQKHKIPTTYVGHPLIERIPPPEPSGMIPADVLRNPRIGLLPGSRRNELRHILPTLLRAAVRLRERRPECRFFLPLADTLDESILQAFRLPSWIEVHRDPQYQLRRTLTFAWTASGTATVENALLGLPMAVVYRTGRMNMFIGRRLVRVPYIGMVNLIAQKGICAEFVQEQCQPEALARHADELLSSPARYEEMKQDLARVRQKMGPTPASLRAAQAIQEFLVNHINGGQKEEGQKD